MQYNLQIKRFKELATWALYVSIFIIIGLYFIDKYL